MTVSFGSAQKRNFWFTLATNYFIDAAVVLLVAISMGAGNNAIWWAIALPLVIEIFVALFHLWQFTKQLLLYQIFFKEKLIEQMVDELRSPGFPEPNPYYVDVDEYLTEAATSSNSSDAVKLTAGITLGRLQALRSFGPRSQAMILVITIEGALTRLSKESQRADRLGH